MQGRWLDRALGGVFSAGFHVALLLGTTLVFLEQLREWDGDGSFVCGWRDQPFVLDRVELPRESFDEKRRIFDEPLSSMVEKPVGDSAVRGASWVELPAPGPGGPEGSAPKDDALLQRRCQVTPGPVRSRGVPLSLTSWNGSGAPLPILCRLKSAQLHPLLWLARHQNDDGGWSCDQFSRHCSGNACAGQGDPQFNVGVTSLSLLAFLGAGYTPFSKDVAIDPAAPHLQLRMGETTKRALQWLVARQDAQGGLGGSGPKLMYNHALATLALSEAYGMTQIQSLAAPAQRAVDYLLAAQNPGLGWRYTPRAGDNDTSVTGWVVIALKSAELSELNVPPDALAGALAWIDRATLPGSSPSVGYTFAGSGKVYLPHRSENYFHHPTMSAIGLLSRVWIRNDRRDIALASTLPADPPAWSNGQIDFYYWYHATLALYQFDGPRGPLWTKWNDAVKKALVENMRTVGHGCARGSWESDVDRWGSEGGRVYATAMNTLTLEIYYRYANALGVNPVGQGRR